MIFNQLTSCVEDVLKNYILNEILLVAISILKSSLVLTFHVYVLFTCESQPWRNNILEAPVSDIIARFETPPASDLSCLSEAGGAVRAVRTLTARTVHYLN